MTYLHLGGEVARVLRKRVGSRAVTARFVNAACAARPEGAAGLHGVARALLLPGRAGREPVNRLAAATFSVVDECHGE